MLRAGGYFVWAAQPVYKHENKLQEQWKKMENLTSRLCWEQPKHSTWSRRGHMSPHG
uniref:Putative S-adenosyl-L-methionine-dependent methyltransferase n=1 Tax=Helianthus annuus TaxID=4232 RepID=A0A251UQG4_HELAN